MQVMHKLCGVHAVTDNIFVVVCVPLMLTPWFWVIAFCTQLYCTMAFVLSDEIFNLH